ncbi:L,D-transpeptidase family protein [Patescibacteria group bacterium]|nr:L,D-transpeptidase family protein [Patescibacteria group bacterium]MBU1921777.1 L,D-transpeptidase family protein [Patescibacteria group bacterium]
MLKKIIQLNIFACLIIFILLLAPSPAHAVDSRDYEVRTWNGFEVIGNFMAFDQGYNGGSSIAAGDLGDDGVPEIVVGSGQGVPPEVKIFRQDGSLVFSFYAYAPSYGQGINVAVCDLDGDGEKEIVTGTQFGGGPHVRVFDSYGNDLSDGGWFAYNKFFRGGVNVACGDWDADGRDEIVTGAGPSGGPHVKIFDSLGNVESEFFAFPPDQLSGVSVAMGQLDQDAAEEVIVAQFSSGDPMVRVFKPGTSNWYKAGEWLAYVEQYQGGVSVSAGDFNNDGVEEVVTMVNGGGGPHVRLFDAKGQTRDEFFAYESDYRGGVRIAMADVNGGGDEIITIPSSRLISGPVGQAKFIDVDITNQRLTAYEWGIPVKTFPVSTGTWRFPTPIGETTVRFKKLWHDYVWSYGVGNPDNYNLPNVQYNLSIFPHVYIHYAYWHNNFGHRMSHGCVNVNLENSEWIYNWADVGTPVETHY